MIHRITVTKDSASPLLALVATSLGESKKRAKKILDSKSVYVNGRCVWIAGHILKPADSVLIFEESEFSPRIQALFEDEDLVVINKPPGILTNGENSFEDELREFGRYQELLAVHRLDRDTTGCVLFSKRHTIKPTLDSLFAGREVQKSYEAIVEGRFPATLNEIDTPLEGKAARTLPKVVLSNSHASYLRIKIESGRMHQIRRHLLSVGHAVIGDKEYKGRGVQWPIKRQMLHAAELSFIHPRTNERLTIKAPLPLDFMECLELFNLKKS